MAYAYSQAVKVFVVAQCRHDVAQAIVAAVPAALLETRSASRNVQLIVSDQYFSGAIL